MSAEPTRPGRLSLRSLQRLQAAMGQYEVSLKLINAANWSHDVPADRRDRIAELIACAETWFLRHNRGR